MELTREQAESRLRRNGVTVKGMEIDIPIQGVGLSLWAAIDCLVNHHKYKVRRD